MPTRATWKTRGREDAALSIEVQLHAGDLGQADRQPRGPSKGRSVVHRVSRWEATWVLVCLRRTRRLQPLGGPRQRVHGRGCDRWRVGMADVNGGRSISLVAAGGGEGWCDGSGPASWAWVD